MPEKITNSPKKPQETQPAVSKPKKLLDQVSEALRTKHYAYRTEETYVDWIKRYILFHKKRHPKDMGAEEIREFITYLATERKVATSIQNQALSAILFLYRNLLNIELDETTLDFIRPKKGKRVPTVLSKGEVRSVISNPLSIIANASRNCSSLMHSGGFV